jgi:MFS family permease
VIALVLQSAAFLGFSASHTFPSLTAWAFAYGFGYSGVSVLFPALLGDLYGRTHAGSITGFAFAVGGGAAAVGPYVAGALFDATGAYDVAFVASSIFNSLALLLLAFLKPPPRPSPATG